MDNDVSNASDFALFNNCIDIGEYLAQSQLDWTNLLGARAVIGVVYIILFVIGVIGNAGVIIRVFNDKKLHSSQYIFLVNLMASDFLLCLTSVPFTPIAVIMKHWIFGELLCRAIPLCQAMSVVITSLSLTAIAIDKYVHILDTTKPPVTSGQASLVTSIIWILACGLSVPLVLSYSVKSGDAYREEFGVIFCGQFCDEWTTPDERKIYGTVVMCIQFVLPMFIIAFCYSSIMRKVQRDMLIENKQFARSLSAVQRLEAIRRKRKVTYILIMMVVAFVGSWAPLTLFNIFRDYGQLPSFVGSQPYFWALVVNSTAMSSVIWNPLLFFWLTGSKQRGSRNADVITDSALISFLLAMNPIRIVLTKRRSKQSEVDRVGVGNTCGNSSGSQFESSSALADDRNFFAESTAKKSSIFNAVNQIRHSVTFAGTPTTNANVIVIGNADAEKAPFVYYSNGKKRSMPSSFEFYRLLPEIPLPNSPRAPRVAAESLSDVSAFEIEEPEKLNYEKTDDFFSIENEWTSSKSALKKGRRPKKGKKRLFYLRLGNSSQF